VAKAGLGRTGSLIGLYARWHRWVLMILIHCQTPRWPSQPKGFNRTQCGLI
jgi:hypothetical protein